MSSPAPLLLDTHVWVRFINGTPGLRPDAVGLIDRTRLSGNVFVSVISIWEVALLARKGRLDLPAGVDRWVEQALKLPGLQLLPFTPQIAIRSVDLPDELNKDPSDRILIATAQVEGLTLMTRDKAIIRFARTAHLSIERA